jgi:tRNA pseudouridine55 synthase
MAACPSGVLVLDKPAGPTSHDVVARARRLLHLKRIGHAGTLDPMATGVLVLAIGEATKLVPWLAAQEKSYEATIALGVETDTLDANGQETGRAPLPEALQAVLAQSRGPQVPPLLRGALTEERTRLTQVPPAYSAIHHEGERAYARARRGEPTELSPREVRVHRLELLAWGDDPPSLAVSMDVSKGYYVRSLARDLAAALGTIGHLASLRRTRAGCFRLDEALAWETPADELAARVMPLSRVASRALRVAQLTPAGALDAQHGKLVAPEDIDSPGTGPHAWFDPAGSLVAVGEVDGDGRGRVIRGFRVPSP